VPVCHQVPREECVTVPLRQCKTVTRQKCFTVEVPVTSQQCHDRVEEVCVPVPRTE
jgi:hypothetical protein